MGLTRKTSSDWQVPCLQVALDFEVLDDALAIAQQAAPFVDIIEAGTPLIKSEGIRAIMALKNAHPDKILCADLKTADAGYLEVRMAAQAGANIVTVLADAYDETIYESLRAANEFGVEIMVDLITSKIPVSRLADIIGIKYHQTGLHYACVHSGLDRQAARRAPLYELDQVTRLRERPQLVVAGGLRVKDIPSLLAYPLAIIIVGGGITHQKNPRKAAEKLRAAIHKQLKPVK